MNIPVERSRRSSDAVSYTEIFDEEDDFIEIKQKRKKSKKKSRVIGFSIAGSTFYQLEDLVKSSFFDMVETASDSDEDSVIEVKNSNLSNHETKKKNSFFLTKVL